MSHSKANESAKKKESFPSQTAQSLGEILSDPSMVIPDDLVLIQSLTNDYECTRDDLSELIESGWLRRVVVGREPHLALNSRKMCTSVPVPRSSDFATPENDAFRQRVLLDVESERIVLYRVVIVVQAIAAMVLTRSLLLYWLLP